jgi:hypothetical protein
MARLFDINTTHDTVSSAANGAATLVFTVTNTTPKPQRGHLRAKALDSAQPGWLRVAGDAERDFAPGFTHQVELNVQVPTGTPPGRFRVRLDALSVANPDDDFTEGPVVSVNVAAPDAPRPQKFPWWVWLVVGLAVLLVAGVVAALVMKGGDTARVPDGLVGQPFDEAKKRVEEAGYVPERKPGAITEGCPGRVIATAPEPGAPAASGAAVALTVGELPYGPDTCKPGFVWREAFRNDHVCVPPESRSRAAQDNQLASSRSETVPATAKDIEDIQRSNPKAATVPKGDFTQLARIDRRILFGQAWTVPMVVRCKAGFTERRASATDRVCVPEGTQLDTAKENEQADSRMVCPKP